MEPAFRGMEVRTCTTDTRATPLHVHLARALRDFRWTPASDPSASPLIRLLQQRNEFRDAEPLSEPWDTQEGMPLWEALLDGARRGACGIVYRGDLAVTDYSTLVQHGLTVRPSASSMPSLPGGPRAWVLSWPHWTPHANPIVQAL